MALNKKIYYIQESTGLTQAIVIKIYIPRSQFVHFSFFQVNKTLWNHIDFIGGKNAGGSGMCKVSLMVWSLIFG